jgi:hypothetical protein
VAVVSDVAVGPFADLEPAKRVMVPSDLNERTIAHQPADARALIRWLPPAVREKPQKAASGTKAMSRA